MFRRCQVSGRQPEVGSSVSHSHMRSSRRRNPNIQPRRFWVPLVGRHIRENHEQQTAARAEMSRQPRDASAARVSKRDAVDGRPRGYLRDFGIHSIQLRQMAHAGELPGVGKASW